MGCLTTSLVIKDSFTVGFPSPPEVNGGYYLHMTKVLAISNKFPSPFEVTGVSYKLHKFYDFIIIEFPSPLEVTRVSYYCGSRE